MQWQELAAKLFDAGHDIHVKGDLLHGSGRVGNVDVTVIGTTGHAAIGVELALAQARAVLDTVAQWPGRPIVLLIDTQGQQLRQRDELLGINRVMAHLGMTIDLARRQGHQVIGLVYDQALSGGFITSGLAADVCYALPEAEIRVMRIPAMARVTKLPESMLTELSQSNPVFAPGVESYVAMGGIKGIWQGDLATALRNALLIPPTGDVRAADGLARGGRRMAATVIQRVLDAY